MNNPQPLQDLIPWTDATSYCIRQRVEISDQLRLSIARIILGASIPDAPDMKGVTSQDAAKLKFDAWWDALGLRYFAADEATYPHRPNIARRLGWVHLVPPVQLWPWLGLVMHIADEVRDSVGRPVTLRNAWRPSNYNAAVAKSTDSDHIDACGIDLDFDSVESRRVAEGVLRRHYDRAELQLSLGLGAQSIHVGVLSRKGQRHWFYESALPEQRRGFYREPFHIINGGLA